MNKTMEQQSAAISQKPLLYQSTPRRHNTYIMQTSRRNWTDSLDTYQNAARREYHLLLANHRQGQHWITLNYHCEYFAHEIKSTWSKLKVLLKKEGIIAFAVVEFTTRNIDLHDGRCVKYPNNCVHYHFLVDSSLSENQLRGIFNQACIDAGLVKNEFVVHYESIPDRKAFEHKCEYTLKYNKFADRAILFQPKTGINKVCSIGRWFINADGTRASKAKIWKAIIARWYPH
jgi:hypothetical protein